jgi:hypothetical protein
MRGGKKEILGSHSKILSVKLLCEKRVGENQGLRGTKGFAVSSIVAVKSDRSVLCPWDRKKYSGEKI